MSYFQAFIMGIIQGVTEFLPISSSAHLVLTPIFLRWDIPEDQIFPFDVLVQMGTLVAVIIYFRNDILSISRAFVLAMVRRDPFGEPESRLGWYLLLASIPAGFIGLDFKDIIEKVFINPAATAIFLCFTAFFLLMAEYLGKRSRIIDDITWLDAIWIGIAQAFAIFPGISRSGATIAGGMTRNLNREAAARFSFLLSIPIMFAAGFLSGASLFTMPEITRFLPILFTGFMTSAIVGYLSIHWLLRFLTRHSFRAFAFYCIGLGLITIIVIYVH